jgi:hypothetical protein
MWQKALSKWPISPGVSATLSASLILNGILWLLTLTLFPQGDAVAILHYSVDTGIDLIGEGKQIIVLPQVGLVILLGNGALGALLRRTDPAAAWILWGCVAPLQLILIGAFTLIWRANS